MAAIAIAETNPQLEIIRQSTDLHALEEIIRRGKVVVLEVAEAIHRVHHAQLWKLTHSSWESWCKSMGISARRSYQLIEYVRIVNQVQGPVPSERAARELARLPESAQRAEALSEAMEEADGQPTASDVRRVVDRKLEQVAPQLPGMSQARVSTHIRKGTQDRRTPRWLFDVLDERFGPFLLDAYASPHNALCERFYTVDDDGNEQDWADVTFANPEFKAMGPCLEQAVRQAELGRRSIILGPVGCSQDWYHRLAIQGTVYVPDCRINYDDPEGNPTGHGLDEPGADRDTIIIGFGGEHTNRASNVQAGIFRVVRLPLKEHRQ